MSRKRIRVLCYVLSGLCVTLALAQAAAVVVEDYVGRTVFGYKTAGIYKEREEYKVKDLDCVCWLDPAKVKEEAGTAGNWFNVLVGSWPQVGGRTYSSYVNPLSAGSIKIHTYRAQGTPARVGAEIDVEYVPAAGDPQNNIHWIQVVTDNHRIVPPGGGHGVPENIVDIRNTATTPYYDNGFAANNRNLYDFPGRTDTANSHTWKAVTHIVTGPAPGAALGDIGITHPGFVWGWQNACIPTVLNNIYRAIPTTPLPRVTTPTVIAPGAHLEFSPVLPVHMTLYKESGTAQVFLQSASLGMDIDGSIDNSGMSSFKLTHGAGQFLPYTFAGEPIGPAPFTLLGGNGWIHWDTATISAHVVFRVSAAGYPDIIGRADGTGVIDFSTRTITIDPDSMGVEDLHPGGVPAVSPWGLLALAGLLLVSGLMLGRRVTRRPAAVA